MKIYPVYKDGEILYYVAKQRELEISGVSFSEAINRLTAILRSVRAWANK